ncbi:MAG: tail fiber protein [Proteobacteria bacterium]|nr:tail fiber protein [Pseudomonadota bacterium]
MNYYRLLLSLSVLTPGLVWTVFDARAQTCSQAPSCSQLGFTNSASDCVGADMVKCPFDNSKVFCRQSKSCAELGYDKTTTQCSGKKTFVCPGDATKVACDDSAMIGEIKLWPAATAPKGWKLCDGSSLSATTYSKLYAVIGTTYGGSSSYFSLPNLKGRVPVGVGYATQYTYKLAETGGQNFVQLSSDQIPDHKHIVPWGETHSNTSYYPWGTWGTGKYGSGDSDGDNKWYIASYMYGRSGYRSYPTSSTSGWGSSGSCSNDRTYSCSTTSHENRMPFLTLNYIIYTGVY